jgi:predicted nucleotidyltransferase
MTAAADEFAIASTNRLLLEKATRVAREFAQRYATDEVVGIVFLGAVARGYFDESADIDIAIIKRRSATMPLPAKFSKVEGLEVHCWLSDFEDELAGQWDMAKRWTFSQAQVFYDPQGDVVRLITERVPLKPAERRQMLMHGLVLSEWYVNRLAGLWVKRGNIVSAHHMFCQGLDYFSEMLFALNNRLVPDSKWRYYCLERLPVLPSGFREGVRDTMALHSFSPAELERRQSAFMALWQEMRPVVEGELQMTFDEMLQVV